MTTKEIKQAYRFYTKVLSDTSLRSEISKQIKRHSFKHFLKVVEYANSQLENRPRLTQVLITAYYSRCGSLGKGCTVLCITNKLKYGSWVEFSFKAGAYGCIMSY